MLKQGYTLPALLLAATFSVTAFAESVNYNCSYTEASYKAPFQKTASTRSCPEGRCSYQISIMGDMATVNNVSGFKVESNEQMIRLYRVAKDPIMGGMDTTEIKINRSDMSFQSRKTTTPSVELTTSGHCQ